MQVDFELGEDVRNETRLKQDELWSSAVADGRAHVSHRELTLLNGPQFCLAIEDFHTIEILLNAVLYQKESPLHFITPEILVLIVDFALPEQGALVIASLRRRELIQKYIQESRKNSANYLPFQICARKRPILNFESNVGAYDVCLTNSPNSLILHEGKLARSGRQLSMTHCQYILDKVFPASSNNLDVCKQSVAPLLSWALTGKSATLLCFGQTGTGKTYTFYGALEYIAHQLIGLSINILFYEVHGKSCYDLLNQRKVVHLRSDQNEVVHVRGARRVIINQMNSAQELLQQLEAALLLRASKITERNPISSRSHAVCTIEISQQPFKGAPSDSSSATYDHNISFNSLKKGSVSLSSLYKPSDTCSSTSMKTSSLQPPSVIWNDMGNSCGKITLVDLAGSERNYETTRMTAVQHKESADINFSLMALKDCFRASHAQLMQSSVEQTAGVRSLSNYLQSKYSTTSHEPLTSNVKLMTSDAAMKSIRIPYRASMLTRVLKSCFTSGMNHKTTIIATIAPTPMDLQHTINTLDHVVLMSPTLLRLIDTVSVEVSIHKGVASNNAPVHTWTPDEVVAWIASAERGKFAKLAIPIGLDGEGLLSLTSENFAELFAREERLGRHESEGPAWVVGLKDIANKKSIAKSLWLAIRRVNQSALLRMKLQHSTNSFV